MGDRGLRNRRAASPASVLPGSPELPKNESGRQKCASYVVHVPGHERMTQTLAIRKHAAGICLCNKIWKSVGSGPPQALVSGHLFASPRSLLCIASDEARHCRAVFDVLRIA